MIFCGALYFTNLCILLRLTLSIWGGDITPDNQPSPLPQSMVETVPVGLTPRPHGSLPADKLAPSPSYLLLHVPLAPPPLWLVSGQLSPSLPAGHETQSTHLLLTLSGQTPPFSVRVIMVHHLISVSALVSSLIPYLTGNQGDRPANIPGHAPTLHPWNLRAKKNTLNFHFVTTAPGRVLNVFCLFLALEMNDTGRKICVNCQGT